MRFQWEHPNVKISISLALSTLQANKIEIHGPICGWKRSSENTILPRIAKINLTMVLIKNQESTSQNKLAATLIHRIEMP